MKNTDLRTLTKEARTELQVVAVRMYKSELKQNKIAKTLGIRESTISSWLKNYKQTGILKKELKRGRPIGNGRTLSPNQEAHIKKLIVDKTPDQYKLPFALWTNAAIRQLIEQEFSMKMIERTICNYLHRWGFSPQRPIKRAYEQQPKAVQDWLDNKYPEIQRQCEKQNGEIHWGDETGISSIEHYPRGYAPIGKTPTITLSHAARERVNMISTITNQGKVQFMIYENSFNAEVFKTFLKQLIKSSNRKVFLVLDNLRVHHAKIIKQWVQDKLDEIELFYLPSYSPELNPDEYLNCDLKAKFRNDCPTNKKGQMKIKMQKHMSSIKNQPKRVMEGVN